MCILCVNTLLKVVGHYDLSILSMSVMGFQKRVDGGGGCFEVYPFFWNLCNFEKPLTEQSLLLSTMLYQCCSNYDRCLL